MSVVTIINEVQDTAERIHDKIQEIFDKVDEILSSLPAQFQHLAGPIRQGLDNLSQKVEEFWDLLDATMQEPGNPDKLNSLAKEWSDVIGNPVGEIADTVKLDRMQTNIEWRGRASEAYKGSSLVRVGSVGVAG